MATISKLANPSFVASSSIRSDRIVPVGPNRFVPVRSAAAPVGLSIRSTNQRRCLVVKCGGVDGNGASTKRTTLHDLYEQQGQSPWYDNLCRPVTDLIPLISSGVRGVTSNPTIFQKAISSSSAYDEQFK